MASSNRWTAWTSFSYFSCILSIKITPSRSILATNFGLVCSVTKTRSNSRRVGNSSSCSRNAGKSSGDTPKTAMSMSLRERLSPLALEPNSTTRSARNLRPMAAIFRYRFSMAPSMKSPPNRSGEPSQLTIVYSIHVFLSSRNSTIAL